MAAGGNGNFDPAFALPAQMTLVGYTRAGTGIAYDSVHVRRPIPYEKADDARAAVGAAGVISFAGPGGYLPTPAYRDFRIRFNVPGGSAQTGAQMTALLLAVEAAVVAL